MSTKRHIAGTGVVAAVIGCTSLLGTGLASAHVTANVYGEPPEQGGYGAIVLRVPNEEAQAGTTKLEVTLKPEYAISSARTKPVPGWTADVQKTPLPRPATSGKGTQVTDAVTKITWTASPGNEIAAGTSQFQEFAISIGPLPDNLDALELPAAQTYQDGTVVNWDQPTPDNGPEPEHPAPTVTLATSSKHGHGTSAGDTSSDASAQTTSTDSTARWLGGIGLGVGALGLGLGGGAVLRARRIVAGRAGTAGPANQEKP